MKKIFLLLLFILGFLLMPNNAMACNSKSSKSASHKEISSKNAKEKCCDKSSHSKNDNHNCDGGKCGHSKCVCPSLYSVFLFYNEVNACDDVVQIAFKTQKFPNFQTLLSTGYGSTWLIPKIG